MTREKITCYSGGDKDEKVYNRGIYYRAALRMAL